MTTPTLIVLVTNSLTHASFFFAILHPGQKCRDLRTQMLQARHIKMRVPFIPLN